jgi:hypothetical protein
LNQAPIPSRYLISCPEDYTAPPATINPILRKTAAIPRVLSRDFLAGCRVPDRRGDRLSRKLVDAAFRTISLVNMDMKRLAISGSAP